MDFCTVAGMAALMVLAWHLFFRDKTPNDFPPT